MDGFNGDPDDAVEVPELTPMDDYDADKVGSPVGLFSKLFPNVETKLFVGSKLID